MPSIVGKSRLKVDDRYHVLALGFNDTAASSPTTYFGQDGPIDTVTGGEIVDVNFDEVMPKNTKPSFDWKALSAREDGFPMTLISGVTKTEYTRCRVTSVGKAVDYEKGTTKRSIRIRVATTADR